MAMVLGRLRAAALSVVLLGLAVQARADKAEPKIPLYPEIVLATDDNLSGDPELAAFRAAVDRASDALVKTPEGEVYDPDAMLPFLADKVEIFAASAYFMSGSVEFERRGTLPGLAALQMLGHMTEPQPDKPVVEQRRGMGVIGRLLWDSVIGRTQWLDGRTCTASYGRLDPDAFAALVAETKIAPRDWLVAGRGRGTQTGDGSLPGSWPLPYQMVPLSGSQRRDGGWVGVLTPQGGTVHIRSWPWEPHFAPYLNSHLCFGRVNGEWKVTAVALRLA